MNWSDDSNLALQRQGQRAKFQRWFGVGEFGHFYFDRAGRARRIEPGQMDGFIHQAIQISDAYFAKANNHGIIFGAGGVVLVMILSFWVPFIKDHQTKFLSAVAGLDLLYLIWQYFADYRKPLNALREELERTLAAATPYPEEIVRPYRRRNLWMIPLIILACMLILVVEWGMQSWTVNRELVTNIVALSVPPIYLIGWLAMRKDKALLAERDSDRNRKSGR